MNIAKIGYNYYFRSNFNPSNKNVTTKSKDFKKEQRMYEGKIALTEANQIKYSSSKILAKSKEVVERGNFDLRICQNCKYFTTKIDGTINVIKGSCSCAAANEEGLEKLVMLWQCCENYAPAREKIVDLKNFRKDN